MRTDRTTISAERSDSTHYALAGRSIGKYGVFMSELPRKRILILAFCCDPEGTMEERNGWHRALIAAGQYDVTVLYLPKPKPLDLIKAAPKELAKHLTFVPIRLSGLSQSLLDRESSFYFAYRRWHRKAAEIAKEIHRERSFDLAHLVTLCGFREPGYVWKLDIPHVWGPIGGSHHFPIGMLRIIDFRSKIRELLRTIVNYVQLHHSFRIRQAAQKSVVLAATQNAATELERGLGVQTRVDLETGIDYEISPLRLARTPGTPFRILWAGRLRAWKGLPLLLHGLSELPPTIEYQVRILGDGSCKSEWQQLAQRLGIERNIQWIEWPNYRETLKHYEWADAFAFTSLRDTSGTGLVEALAAGCPLISVDHQGAADLLEHDCGMPVDVTNYQGAVAGFKDAVTQMATDPDLWLRKSHSATNYARHLHWDNRSQWIMEVYCDAMGKTRESIVESEPKEANKLGGILALADQGIVSFTNFATILLLARYCEDVVFAAIALAAQFISYSRSAMERLLSASYGALIHRSSNKSKFTGSSVVHASVFTAVITVSTVFCAILYYGFSNSKALAFGLLMQCVLLPCQMLRDYFRSISLSRLRTENAFLLDIISCTVQLGLISLLIYSGNRDSISLSLAWALANAVFILTWLARPPIQLELDKSRLRADWVDSWDYSKWLVLGRCLGIASYLFVPWLLTHLHGDQQWTLFAKATNLVGLSLLFVTGLNGYFMPLTVKSLHSRGLGAMKGAMAWSFTSFAIVLAGLCVVYAVVGHQAMQLLYKTSDPNQGWLLTLLGANVLTFSIAIVASNGLAAMKQSRASFWGELANFGVSAAVAMPLIQWQGSLGAALAILSGSLASTVVTALILIQKMKQVEQSSPASSV